MTTASQLILKKIIDKPSPEVGNALRRLTNALERPPSVATDPDVWQAPQSAARGALSDLKAHYAEVRRQIANAPQILGDAPQKRPLLDALDAEIQAIEQFEAALFPRTPLSSSQTRAFRAAKQAATTAGEKMRQAEAGL